jgi:hypothetical protein
MRDRERRNYFVTYFVTYLASFAAISATRLPYRFAVSISPCGILSAGSCGPHCAITPV